ncbi:M14 family metallopeptidase [Shewanella sp. GXUN23E]|uniref:M14 family metallopeptidase n=1 Tax=Shewanella sp. GXUN23E TaxID=3422498 RepID=UPI003D7EAED3
MRSPFQSYVWQSQVFACDSNDLEHFQGLLSDETARLSMTATCLGDTGRFPLMMYTSPAANAHLPSVLVCAGFHGDEAAGPWGILKWLMAQDASLFANVNLSLLPVVCPTAFRKGQKYNRQGLDAFRGLVWQQGRAQGDEQLSEEGAILLRHAQLLVAAGRDGMLCCGETPAGDHALLSSFEPRQQPGAFTQTLMDSLGQFFPLQPTALGQACEPNHSNSFNCFDGGFTAFMVRGGARFGATATTPSSAAFDERVRAISGVITGLMSQYRQSVQRVG